MSEEKESNRSWRGVVCTILGIISILGIVCMFVDIVLLLADALMLAPPAFVREGVRFLQSWSFWSSSHGGLLNISSLFLLIYIVPQFIMRLLLNNEYPKWLMHTSIALFVPVSLLVLSYCVITFTVLELPIPHAKVTLAESAANGGCAPTTPGHMFLITANSISRTALFLSTMPSGPPCGSAFPTDLAAQKTVPAS